MKLQKKLVAALLLLGLTSSSCLGPDNLYNGIKSWNANLSEKDWVNEGVFIGLMIIPVYPIAMLCDVVVFNTVEYWSGDNLVNPPEPFPGFKREKRSD
jgi:uncharacterized protein DUF3332